MARLASWSNPHFAYLRGARHEQQRVKRKLGREQCDGPTAARDASEGAYRSAILTLSSSRILMTSELSLEGSEELCSQRYVTLRYVAVSCVA